MKDLQQSRSKWKARSQKNKSALREVAVVGGEKIARHKYKSEVVRLCISIYLLGSCSLRGVVRVLSYLDSSLGLLGGKIPSKSTILNWLQKCGYYVYEQIDVSKYKAGYSLIVDECMVIGQQRMLMVLLCKAQHVGSSALSYQDALVVSIAVKPSWNGADIEEVLAGVREKMGAKPSYIICDGASNLSKGIEKNESIRLCDVGHEIARLTEKVYGKNELYTSFSTACAQCKLKEVMRPTSYLLPPKQRTIARFMNLSTLIQWGKKHLHLSQHASGTLTQEEQNVFKWIENHRDIIEELDAVFTCANQILNILKTRGLSYETVKECKEICAKFEAKNKIAIVQGSQKERWIQKIIGYLDAEKKKLPNAETTWNASSDLIESFFGTFKARKADNPLNGITPSVLLLPLLTQINPAENKVNMNFKTALESVFLADLAQWKEDNLIENQVVKRNKILKF